MQKVRENNKRRLELNAFRGETGDFAIKGLHMLPCLDSVLVIISQQETYSTVLPNCFIKKPLTWKKFKNKLFSKNYSCKKCGNNHKVFVILYKTGVFQGFQTCGIQELDVSTINCTNPLFLHLVLPPILAVRLLLLLFVRRRRGRGVAGHRGRVS